MNPTNSITTTPTVTMTPDQIQAAYTALQSAVQASTNTGEQQIDTSAAAKAPGLAVGDNAYDVGRYVTPAVQAASDKLVVGAKQAMVKKTLQDASQNASDNFTTANDAYNSRQRDYYRQQAIVAAQRYAAQQAAYAAASSGSGGSADTSVAGGGNAVDAAASSGGKNYIGNNDLRGRLNYLAQNGDKDAAVALKYVGNDGKYNLPSTVVSPAILASLNKFGFTNSYTANKPSATPPKTSPFVTSLVTGKLK